MVHEDTMQTERTRTHDERRVQNLLLVNSMGLSFAAHVQNVVGRLMRVSSEANRFLDGTLVHSPSQTDQPDGCAILKRRLVQTRQPGCQKSHIEHRSSQPGREKSPEERRSNHPG